MTNGAFGASPAVIPEPPKVVCQFAVTLMSDNRLKMVGDFEQKDTCFRLIAELIKFIVSFDPAKVLMTPQKDLVDKNGAKIHAG